MINIYKEINRLVQYGVKKNLIENEDIIYTRNQILSVLELDEFEDIEIIEEKLESPTRILDNMLKWASETELLESNTPVYRDLLDTKIMNCLIPRPSDVIRKFKLFYKNNPKKATDYYYELSKSSNYIRTDRMAKNQVWKTNTEYGELDITINLSKPEKDPKAIMAARNKVLSSYPKCLLCKENEGYAGRVNHPARQNHRVIPLSLNKENWFLQYSPYGYYNEHSIIFKAKHEPMKISKTTFERVLEFVDKYPHYFIGSNADLPIVGGSILSHDHFQGGNYQFAMANAPVIETFKIENYEEIEVGIVKWSMSVLRVKGKNRVLISELADKILKHWKQYSDDKVQILSHTDDIPHNTITPIARKKDDCFELDLVLRNNRTNEEYPDGIFHPHAELHHIKKENIGLIEVMGLAVLPARLKDELEKISYYLLNPEIEEELRKEETLEKHILWYYEIKEKYSDISKENIENILRNEVGMKFAKVLEHAGVFKNSKEGKEAFLRFIKSVN